MARGASRRWLLLGVALLACTGVWLGHTLEYARVWGWSGIQREIGGSAHLYMVPLGLALTVLLAGLGAAALSVRRRLIERSERASRILARAWRGHPPLAAVPAPLSRPQRLSAGRQVALLAGALALLQVTLYLLQENIESAAAGLRLPGMSPVVGVHWAASLIQVGLALLLAAASVAVASVLRRRRLSVERLERAVRGVLAILAARRSRAVTPALSPPRAHGAAALFGTSIWCRPPPLLVP